MNSKQISILKNDVLNRGYNIKHFQHQKELNAVLKKAMRFSEKDKVFNGFMIILNELEGDITLQDKTLLQSMKNVRDQFCFRRNFKHTLAQINAITMAIAYIRMYLKLKAIRDRYAIPRINSKKTYIRGED